MVEFDCQGSFQLRFKPFQANTRGYCNLATTIYQYYKLVDSVSVQIEKLNNLYVENFLEQSKDFEGFDCFKRMFVKYVYREKYIHGFIHEVIAHFRENPFYASRFGSSFELVLEIQQNLEKL
jgi:hypothetical protein